MAGELLDAFASGRYHHMPVMQGTDLDEGNIFTFIADRAALARKPCRRIIEKHFGHIVAKQAEAKYPLSPYQNDALAS